MNSSCLEKAGEDGHNMPDEAWLLSDFQRFQSWLCTLDSSRGSSLGVRLKFALFVTNIFFGDIPAAGLASLVLGKKGMLESLLHPMHFPDGEIVALFGSGAVSGLYHLPPLLSCSSGALELGDSAPAAFLSQSWPTGVCVGKEALGVPAPLV